ncbi:MAG: hypothetical protein WB611_02015 [Stellaceae bacterium]
MAGWQETNKENVKQAANTLPQNLTFAQRSFKVLIGGRSAHIPADYRDVNAGGMFITQHGTIEISADGKRPPGLQIRIVYSPNSTADPKQDQNQLKEAVRQAVPPDKNLSSLTVAS